MSTELRISAVPSRFELKRAGNVVESANSSDSSLGDGARLALINSMAVGTTGAGEARPQKILTVLII